MATTTEALAEEDEPEESTTTAEALAEEAEETMRLSEYLQWKRWRCVYRPREFTMTTVVLDEEDGPKDSATTTEASAKNEE